MDLWLSYGSFVTTVFHPFIFCSFLKDPLAPLTFSLNFFISSICMKSMTLVLSLSVFIVDFLHIMFEKQFGFMVINMNVKATCRFKSQIWTNTTTNLSINSLNDPSYSFKCLRVLQMSNDKVISLCILPHNELPGWKNNQPSSSKISCKKNSILFFQYVYSFNIKI